MPQRSPSPRTGSTGARPDPGSRSTCGSRLVANRAAALLLLVVATPVLALLSLLIRLTSPGPVLFRQVRLGLHGQRFAMLKLRTMIDGAESMQPHSWTQKNDPRITPVGAILRRWHLDELPQLINVVRGEMALVGPRPETPEIAARLRPLIPDYDRRLEVMPGIVGLAQINLPADSGVESVRKKLHLDLEYIRTATPWLDLRMLAWSCLRIAGLPSAPTSRWLALDRTVEPDQPRRTRPEHVVARQSVATASEAPQHTTTA